MGKLSAANLKKTIYYLKRNGLRETWYAARERLTAADTYTYEPPTEEVLARQRQQALSWEKEGEPLPTFSLAVPAYRTDPDYLKALIMSVCAQSYPFWELILADATEDDGVERTVEKLCHEISVREYSEKIRYHRLAENKGISENTNEAICLASSEYIGLLDHDDILTPDALFEMAAKIRREAEQDIVLQIIYSDEDKCDSRAQRYYEPNRKERFNYDLLLSNNYICHFLVMKREVLQKLKLRREYDGAQDYDLLLRAVAELKIPSDPAGERLVGHVPKVLYHWRCHEASTAENPQSKAYAYDAGLRALQDHLKACGVTGLVSSMKHVGFYEVTYPGDMFAERKDIGAVGGPVIRHGRIIGGRMKSSGKIYYENLPVHYSGYMHRAALTQDARAVDIRNLRLRQELWGLFEQITGVPYRCVPGTEMFDVSALPADTDYVHLSLELCRAIRKERYRILWRR